MISTYTNHLTFGTLPTGEGLKKALGMPPQAILDEVAASGLKGRGGAGFPTSMKWSFAANSDGHPKYVICNADEGEPGTFKDRVILSQYADLVLEGMTIAARAIGASEGILYLRAEYTYLRPYLETVLARRRDQGLLGRNVGGVEGFDFDVAIFMGAGAYVCGEETALIESLEGYRGEPRNRPPFPVHTGFLGRPSVVNNVETLAWVAGIFAQGASWFHQIGTEKSPGWKIFSVSGDCMRPGVYEFPFGISVQELLEAVGGMGAKAVQVGGVSGQCVPACEFGRKISYEDVATGGSIIVFGPQRDMVQVARNFMEFFVDESCGQCTPCRIGTAKLLEGIEKLQAGTCSMGHLEDLLELGATMQIASKCGLGQSSPNAFLSIVRHFKDEIMASGPRSASGTRN